MALTSKEAIIYTVRVQNLPHWRIYENEQKKAAGNFVFASSEEGSKNIETSIADLSRALDLLSSSRYLLRASKTSTGDSRNGIDTALELGFTGNSNASLAGTHPPGFFIEGIGTITPENFESALDSKIKKYRDEEKKAEELHLLKERVKELEAEQKSNDANFKSGIMAIGAFAWPAIKQMPAAKEMLGAIGGILMEVNKSNNVETGPALSSNENDSIGQVGEANAQERVELALEKLAANNPDFIGQIEMLAKVKDENPDLFEQGIDTLKSMA